MWDSVAFDRQGRLYGTTSGGGAFGYGTVFEMVPNAHGNWSESVLRSFKNDDPLGDDLNGGLILDARGNVFGTATDGGGPETYGTVFEMTRRGDRWVISVLHRFGRKDKAGAPLANLAMDAAGNIFGAAYSVFELSRLSTQWKEQILHEFNGQNGDGRGAASGLVLDQVGNIYGTTRYGGGSPVCTDGCGTVYELQPQKNVGLVTTAWRERILHRFGFSSADGVWPGFGQLAMDDKGSLYGVANGGKYRAGILFKLTRAHSVPGDDDVWQETVLYNFGGSTDGVYPGGGVILDTAGSLYGTTTAGGSPDCECGVVYKLAPGKNGKWVYTVLHTFHGSDGALPDANLTFGPDGKVYGTTAAGGMYGGGVVFQIAP